MSSREAILQAVRRNRPPAVPLPDVGAFARPDGDLAALFVEIIHEIGGRAVEVEAGGIAAVLAELYPDARTTASAGPSVDAMPRLNPAADSHTLAALDLLVCEGTLGIAENGAIWLAEAQMVHRVAPFLAQHLAIVLDRRQIVWNMHEAYASVRVDDEAFGVFIAGPSKTADIEQALVIGAHGPRSLTVLLTTD